MCNTCGFIPCGCGNVNYSFNWMPTSTYPCNPCSTTEVCKKTVNAKCISYNGIDLTNLAITSPANVELILSTINIVLGEINDAALVTNTAQATKNANILIALNDINDRLNILESASHTAYTI